MNSETEQKEAFIPISNGNTYTIDGVVDGCKVTILPATKKTLESDYKSEESDPYWNPYNARNVLNPTTDCETLTHLLKACLGTGILAMPFAFKSAGVTFGVISTIIVGLICTHCSYLLIKSAQALYFRTKVSYLTFPDVGKVAFANGPTSFRIFSEPARFAVIIGIFLTYFGTCSAYVVIIAKNIQPVVEEYTNYPLDVRIYMLLLLFAFIFLSYVPDLKALSIFSMVANVLMGCVIGISLYYIVFEKEHELKSPWSMPQMASIYDLPEYFSITIFAMEAIGIMIPLENNMANPKHFLGTCGILNRGMSIVSMIYLMIGFLGYLKYGNAIQPTISLNLPTGEMAPQVAKIFTAAAIFFTYGLQFYVCLDIVWNEIKHHFTKQTMFYNYVLRTVLVVLSVAVALGIPEIDPFLGLVGALFFSFLGIILPILLDFVVFWESGFGYLKWRLWKNIFILIFGILALIFGTHSSLKKIYGIYQNQ